MDALTGREWSVVFWAAVLLIVVLWTEDGRASAAGLVKAFFAPSILSTLGALYLWLTGVILIAARLDMWNWNLLPDTVIWFVVSGVGAYFASFRAAKEEHFFRREVRDALSAAAVVSFFFNLQGFNFFVEVPLQALLFLLAAVAAVADQKDDYASVRPIVHGLLGLIVTAMLVTTLWKLGQSWSSLDRSQTGLELALALWLPLAALPYMYVLALTITYGEVTRRMRVRSGRKLRPTVLLGVIWVLRGRLRLAHDLTTRAGGALRLGDANSFTEVGQMIQAFESTQREEHRRERQKAADLTRYAGVRGSDTDGLVLDKRELSETKAALRWLETCHAGHYPKGSRYRKDLMSIVDNFDRQGLPSDHGVVMKVHKKGQSWFAWRRTPSGLVLGIGSLAGPPDEWLFEGFDPPSGYPQEGGEWGSRWDTPPHWASDD